PHGDALLLPARPSDRFACIIERDPEGAQTKLVSEPPLLVIAGPTGVGKTATAVALARRLPIAVVSADSRQVYRGLDAATGKPTPAERAAVPHHLVDIVDPDERYQAARFRADALAAIERIRGDGRLPVVVGGTGLYIRALVRGLDPAPPRDPEFRRELEAVAATAGAAALHARLEAVAPEVARRLHPHDRVRAEPRPALEGIGYRQFIDVVRGRATATEALRHMQRETVRYAKRQWTWFAREPGIQWIDVDRAGGAEGAAETIRKLAETGGLLG